VELTGITDEMLEDAPAIESVIADALAFCGELPLLGHRVIFDYSFLKRAAVNAKLEFEKNGIDTLGLCRTFMEGSAKKNLTSACACYGVPQSEAHRAEADAESAHFLYQKLKERHGDARPELFTPKPLIYKAKREQPATKRQKEYLQDLLKYHRIDVTVCIDSLSRSEASRLVDKIILKHGKIPGRRSGADHTTTSKR
jgi:DNA polymerase-3 subunit alpha (Gram-positive type)